MQEFLFHPALWMPAAAFAIAIALFIYGNNRVQPAVRNVGAGLLGLVLVWCVAAYWIKTRVEQCITRTRAITAAVETGDWGKVTALLDKTTSLEFLRGNVAISNAAQTAAQSYGLKDIRTFGTDAVEGPGTVDVTIRTLLEGAQPLTAEFRFEYEQRSDGMLLSKIVPVRIGDKSMDQVRNAIR